MCGIAGIIGNSFVDYTSRMNEMLDKMKYRGPDGKGIHNLNDIILGHVRLSIIDINSGNQPMIGANGNTEIVFNGEIYGFQKIKKDLDDYIFSNESDTEVILALYEKYSDYKEMLSNLPGMFSFALWDKRNKTLFCARDRFGEKPFYYAFGNNGEFIFASEIKSIIASGLVVPKINMSAVGDFLQHSYLYPNTCIYDNIYVLPPASYLVWRDGKINIERYWTFPKTNEVMTMADAVEEFQHLFRQAVERQMVADVPVGAYLSGGLDSGSVVAQMAQLTKQVTTISFASTLGFDESKLAETMAKKYNTKHFVARDNDLDIKSLLFKMQEIFDEPMADPAAISAYVISQEAAKHVKVVLSGDAGDEMLGGYSTKYRSLYYAKMMSESNIPLELQKMWWNTSYVTQKIVRKVKFILGADVASTVFKGVKLADTDIKRRAITIAQDYPENITYYYRKHNMNMISNSDIEKMGAQSPQIDYVTEGLLEACELDNAIRCDVLDYLPGNCLLKTDRTSMATSIECRTPFCDVDLANFCISLPFCLKVSSQGEKLVLRNSMKDMWTKEISNNIKTGFAPPWDKWLVSEEVKDIFDQYLYAKNAKIWDYLDYNETIKYFNKVNGWPRWSILNLALWMATR